MDLLTMDADLISLETMIAAQETAKWTYWMMFATWMAGFATLTAVIVSLYIANRKPSPKFDASIYSGLVIPEGGSMAAILIDIANLGFTSIVISSLVFVYNGKTKFALTFHSSSSAKLPKKIEHGESALFIIETPNFNQFLKKLKQDIEDGDGDIRKLKLEVNLATRVKRQFKLDNALHETLMNL